MKFTVILLQLMLYLACHVVKNQAKVVGHVKDDDEGGTITIVDIQDDNKTQYLNQNFEQGNYNYGYDIKPSGPVGQFHHENKSPDNVVYGCYGHEGPDARNQMTFYISDAWGYRPVRQDESVEIFYPADNPEGTGHMNGKLTSWSDLVFPDMCAHFAERIASSTNLVTKSPAQIVSPPASIAAKLQSTAPLLPGSPTNLPTLGNTNTQVPSGSFDVIQFNTPTNTGPAGTQFSRLTSITPTKGFSTPAVDGGTPATHPQSTLNAQLEPVSNNIIPNRFNTGLPTTPTSPSRGTSTIPSRVPQGVRTTSLPTGPAGATDIQSSNVGPLLPNNRVGGTTTTQNLPFAPTGPRTGTPLNETPLPNTRPLTGFGQTTSSDLVSTNSPPSEQVSTNDPLLVNRVVPGGRPTTNTRPLSTQPPLPPSTLPAASFEEANNGPLTTAGATRPSPTSNTRAVPENRVTTNRAPPTSRNTLPPTTSLNTGNVALRGQTGRVPTVNPTTFTTENAPVTFTTPNRRGENTVGFTPGMEDLSTNVVGTTRNPEAVGTKRIPPTAGSSSGTTANFGAPTSFHRGQTGSQSSPLASQDEDIPSLAPSTVPETSRPATGTTPTFGPSTGFSGTFNNPNTLKPSSTIQQTVPSRGNRRPTTTPSFTTGPQETGATPEGSRTSPIRQPTSATRSVSRFTNTAPQNTQSTDSEILTQHVPTTQNAAPAPNRTLPSQFTPTTGTDGNQQTPDLTTRPVTTNIAFGGRRPTTPTRSPLTFSPRIPSPTHAGIQRPATGVANASTDQDNELFCASQCSSCRNVNNNNNHNQQQANTRDEDFAQLPGAILSNIPVIFYPDCSENAFSRPAIVPFCPSQKSQCKDSQDQQPLSMRFPDSGLSVTRIARKVRRGRQHSIVGY